MRIVIEPEVPGDSRSLFRLLVGEKVGAEGMTAAQIHILVGDILEKGRFKRKRRRQSRRAQASANRLRCPTCRRSTMSISAKQRRKEQCPDILRSSNIAKPGPKVS